LELPQAPQFDAEALEEFVRLLGHAKLYIEFGSGGSTVLASELQVPTISVESDRRFASALKDSLGPSSKAKILHVNLGPTGEWGRPLFTRRTSKRLAQWQGYSSAPWESLPAGEFPDFILVDGRFRRACALEAARRAIAANRHAVLMFDDYYNVGRDDYHTISRYLGQPRRLGRAAFFSLGREHTPVVPTDEELLEANADPR
jgi:hypothetical protein